MIPILDEREQTRRINMNPHRVFDGGQAVDIYRWPRWGGERRSDAERRVTDSLLYDGRATYKCTLTFKYDAWEDAIVAFVRWPYADPNS